MYWTVWGVIDVDEISKICECCGVLSHYKMVEPDERGDGWEKSTIQYVLANMGKIKHKIRLSGQGLKKDQLEDIFQNLMIYLLKAEDYDCSRENACNSIENYIGTGINHVIQRYRTELKKVYSNIESCLIKDKDGDEINQLDLIPDGTSLEKIIDKDCDLGDALEAMTRYVSNVDIFAMLYVRLLSSKETYEMNLTALGFEKRDLNELCKLHSREEEVENVVKALSITNKEDALRELEKHVYGYKMIKKAICD